MLALELEELLLGLVDLVVLDRLGLYLGLGYDLVFLSPKDYPLDYDVGGDPDNRPYQRSYKVCNHIQLSFNLV